MELQNRLSPVQLARRHHISDLQYPSIGPELRRIAFGGTFPVLYLV